MDLCATGAGAEVEVEVEGMVEVVVVVGVGVEVGVVVEVVVGVEVGVEVGVVVEVSAIGGHMKEQLYIDGTEPDRNPDLESAIHLWLQAQSETKVARETLKLRHEILMARIKEAGMDRYQYTDPDTGERRVVVVKSSHKMSTIVEAKASRKRKAPKSEDFSNGRGADAFASVRERMGKP